MARTPLMAGNWKMNLDHVEATGLVQKLAWTLDDLKYDPSKSEAAVIVPFTDIRTVQTLIEGDKLPLAFGAQDVSLHASGAYTGEISAAMLAKLNCSYVVVGHSERRDYHGETDEIVNSKAKVVQAAGMTPIVCVGEKLDVRKAGEHVPFVLAQVDKVLAGLSADEVGALVIAYEPVWAIGTGEVATPEDAQEVCGAIRGRVAELVGQAAADAVRIQYGGSAKSSNIVELMAQPDVDGGLVGGASLDAAEFAKIVTFYQRA
ncbi:MAG: triose-phosphate isomerase [Micropruina glycogenica]|jgi:triosephosphate isomerase|uniref:Triosephosphate isomerase n=1 Tax=Micropruina glycogenica TaxID=75385 RepID=A0A2N9JG41_9ACTN|nr:triose-phosphate isomerase [Micropruina glycogenica]MCB0892443.1 triose-phosphate isomerase [Propionibacteriaceae bacterium]SPD87084.1 triose phosphate isomerase [Micropruina glycogenica]